MLIIIGGLATLVTPSLGGATDLTHEATTVGSMTAVRNAIQGQPGSGQANYGQPIGYLSDVGEIPDTLRDLFVRPVDVPEFSIPTGRGWRGPYLMTSTGRYTIDPLDGFHPLWGQPDDPALIDAWGKPIVLQIPDPDGDGLFDALDRRHARLVSAGPNGRIDTPHTDPLSLQPSDAYYPPLEACQDDYVLYLRVPDLRP